MIATAINNRTEFINEQIANFYGGTIETNDYVIEEIERVLNDLSIPNSERFELVTMKIIFTRGHSGAAVTIARVLFTAFGLKDLIDWNFNG